MPFASYCDEITADDQLADGGIVAVDLAVPASRTTFDAVPWDGNGGGIWGYEELCEILANPSVWYLEMQLVRRIFWRCRDCAGSPTFRG